VWTVGGSIVVKSNDEFLHILLPWLAFTIARLQQD